jgi:hypothetical protein
MSSVHLARSAISAVFAPVKPVRKAATRFTIQFPFVGIGTRLAAAQQCNVVVITKSAIACQSSVSRRHLNEIVKVARV